MHPPGQGGSPRIHHGRRNAQGAERIQPIVQLWIRKHTKVITQLPKRPTHGQVGVDTQHLRHGHVPRKGPIPIRGRDESQGAAIVLQHSTVLKFVPRSSRPYGCVGLLCWLCGLGALPYSTDKYRPCGWIFGGCQWTKRRCISDLLSRVRTNTLTRR